MHRKTPYYQLRFADGFVVNAEKKEEADVLADHLNTTTIRYKVEIGVDKTKMIKKKHR